MTEEIIIDAENAVVGRLASYVAKQALQGKKVIIVNAEKAIFTGREEDIIEKYRVRRERGGIGMRGPFYPKTPERILKRIIRGMLPYKKGKGREDYKRIRCYVSIPAEFKDKKMIKSGKGQRGVSLQKISRRLRGLK